MLNYAADNGIEAEVRFLARYLIAVDSGTVCSVSLEAARIYQSGINIWR